MPAFQRAQVLHELRGHMWRYLNGFGVVTDSQALVAGLFGLLPGEVGQLLAAHLVLSHRTEDMLQAAKTLLPRLQGSVTRARRELLGEVEGDVDWPRTRQRRVELGEPTLFACTPPLRRYETLHARAILTSLVSCEGLAHRSGLQAGPRGGDVTARAIRARRLLAHGKLAGVRPLGSLGEGRLAHLERRPDFTPVCDYLRWVRDGVEARERGALHAILSSAVLAPSENSALFELLVGFRMVDHLMDRHFAVRRLQAMPNRGVPFAVLSRQQRTVTLWRQRGLGSVLDLGPEHSLYSTIRTAQGLRSRALIPDYVMEFDGRVLPVEVKLAEREGVAHLRTGLVEALAYIKDFDAALAGQPLPHALVVAWDVDVQPAPGQTVMISSQVTLPEALDTLLGL
jgi:hypothetical protein